MSILVVDDQPLNRVLLGQLLRSLDLHVIEACDGREGLQAYLQNSRNVAFIFLDLMMPVLDGFKAALSIRSAESQKGWLPVPIVAFTSEDVRQGSPMWQQCMQSGFNDVVPKAMTRGYATQLLYRFLPDLKLRVAAACGSQALAACSTGATRSSGEGTASSVAAAPAGSSKADGSNISCDTTPTCRIAVVAASGGCRAAKHFDGSTAEHSSGGDGVVDSCAFSPQILLDR